MPTDLNLVAPPELVSDKPPSKLVWTISFLGVTIAGMIIALLLWPKNEPTRTPWFWICLGFYPPAAAALIVLSRFGAYYGRVLDAQAWNTVRERHEQRVIKRASDPMMLLKGCCRFAADFAENPASKIADRTVALSSQASIAEPGNIRARWLTPPGMDMFKGPVQSDIVRQQFVLGWLFDELVGDLEETIQALPEKIPLAIHVSVTGHSMTETFIREAWKGRWNTHALRRAAVTIEAKPLPVVTLRAWLDAKGQVAQQQARLVVHIQLHKVLSENPPPDSAEMAVAVLLVRTQTAERHGLIAQAQVHRPIRNEIESFTEALAFALRCGRSLPAAICHVWHTGFDVNSSLKLFDTVKLAGIVTSIEPNGQHDIDQSIGSGGAAAGWLAVVCAAEHALSTATPQLIAQTQGNDTWFGIVSPPPSRSLDKPV